MADGLSQELLRFIHAHVPTYPAAELLIFLSRRPGERWTPEAVSEQMRTAMTSALAVLEYARQFEADGLVAFEPDGTFHYAPATPESEAAVAALARAYDEQPVTLVRTIYSIAEAKIRSFADAFSIKRDDP
jgi:hypothetical protein